MTHYYSLFGLVLASDLECPELVPAPACDVFDIRILLEPVPATIDNPIHVRRHVQIGHGVYQFQIDGVARYRIEQGRTIRVEPLPDARDADVRLFLLGTALGAMLHQQGRIPLHVSAVAVDGGVHAFCGESGAGKSTLAAALHRHGLPVLCDDVGVAVPDDHGEVMFYPGFPRIKLWQDALDHFGIDKTPLVRDLARTDKYHLILRESFNGEPLPLRRLYALTRSPGDTSDGIFAVPRHEAIGLLIDNTYRPGMVRRIGGARNHLRQCGQIAASIRTYRYARPWSLERMQDSLDRLLAHLNAEHD